ncbi:S41 family peptidase [Lacibacterium aquatile]|uniref:S41 family peptidase n=1 Tax=Lacibacterium aquatile TaxID=1168082 RepID=A0ABW5DUY8_9PROT
MGHRRSLMSSSALKRGAAIAVLVALGAVGGQLLTPTVVEAQNKTSETYRQLDLFSQVFERVRADYVDKVTDEQLIEAAVNGMLTSLDPHSSYMNPKNYKDMQVQTQGEFGGLGIEVSMEQGFVKVVSPIDDTPASRAGLKPGDFITHLNGESLQGLALNEAVEKMRGPINSEIKVTIRREGREPFDVSLQRAAIKIESVRGRLEGEDIAYVRITTFSQQTDSGLRKTFDRIKEQSKGKLKGLVLDLRRNPGGLLDQAVAVSDDFLTQGEIVSTSSPRRPEAAQRYNAKPDDITGGLPIVVLIDDGSASASEIVAGALQDHRRAVVMGTKSFGKGSVQTIMPLGSGNGAMRLTTALYYTPSGRSIQAKGIEPDIVVNAAKVEAVNTGERRSEASLRGAIRNPNETPASGAAPIQPVTPTEQAPLVLGSAEDYQLARAVDLIRAISLYTNRTPAN